jgi:hypothetical protein
MFGGSDAAIHSWRGDWAGSGTGVFGEKAWLRELSLSGARRVCGVRAFHIRQPLGSVPAIRLTQAPSLLSSPRLDRSRARTVPYSLPGRRTDRHRDHLLDSLIAGARHSYVSSSRLVFGGGYTNGCRFAPAAGFRLGATFLQALRANSGGPFLESDSRPPHRARNASEVLPRFRATAGSVAR